MISSCHSGQHCTLSPYGEGTGARAALWPAPSHKAPERTRAGDSCLLLQPCLPQTFADSECQPEETISGKVCPRLKETKNRRAFTPEPPWGLAPSSGSLAVLSSACSALCGVPIKAGQGSGDISCAAAIPAALSWSSRPSRAPARTGRLDQGVEVSQPHLRSSRAHPVCLYPRPADSEVPRWRIKLISVLYPAFGTQLSTHPGRVGTEWRVRLSDIQAPRRRGMV